MLICQELEEQVSTVEQNCDAKLQASAQEKRHVQDRAVAKVMKHILKAIYSTLLSTKAIDILLRVLVRVRVRVFVRVA